MKIPTPSFIQQNVSLQNKNTFAFSGTAEFFAPIYQFEQIMPTLSWAKQNKLPIRILGGGSNVIIPDEKINGIVLQLFTKGISNRRISENEVEIKVLAGHSWDDLVQEAVTNHWAGIECLSGIPGFCGAAPIQNIGAYGQEVADTILSVDFLELSSGKIFTFQKKECHFSYRDSFFRKQLGNHLILSIRLLLTEQGRPSIRYSELQSFIEQTYEEPSPSLQSVRDAVFKLRRKKSMIFDKNDENHRSVGSFFTNPIINNQDYLSLVHRLLSQQIISRKEEIPTYITHNAYKIPAAWLIEKAGFNKGFKKGHVGISSRHSLCLIQDGMATSNELIKFAYEIQTNVYNSFGLILSPEPIFWDSTSLLKGAILS